MMAFKGTLVVLFLLGLSSVATGHWQKPFDDNIIKCALDIENCFLNWCFYYGHRFSPEEKHHRFQIFKENVIHVTERLSEGSTCHFRLGLNAFAALSKEEFDSTRLGGFLKKRQGKPHSNDPNYDKSKWNNSSMGGTQRRLLEERQHERKLAALPQIVDWRTKGVVNPVRDQYPCSGCYAFATVATVESFIAIKTGKLPQLSEKDIINCCVNCPCCGTPCDGGYIESSFDYAKSRGVVPESVLPFKDPIERSCPIAAGEKRKTLIEDYQVKYWPELKEADIMALVSQHPVAVYFYADTDFEARWYKSGVYTGPCKNRPTTGNHFMTIVGYGTDPASRLNYWLVRNSWGPSWGENGYIKILRGPGASGDGVCGIQYLAAWPIQKTVRRRGMRRGMRGMKGGKGMRRKGHRPKKGGITRVAPQPAPLPTPAAPLALGQCDFFFMGPYAPEQAPIPVVAIKEWGDNTYATQIAAYNHRTKTAIPLLTGNSNLACTDNGVRKPGAPPLPECHFVFHFTNGHLSTKTFNVPGAYNAFTQQAFIQIPISSALLAGDLNLNSGDGNTDFPEARRCIVFIPSRA